MFFFLKRKVEKHGEDSFLDHLDELRVRIIRALIYLLVAIVLCSIQADFIVDEILLRPMLLASPNAKLQNLVPYGQLTLYMQAVLFSSLVIAFPIIMHQVWKFIEPGLTPKEKRGTRFVVLFLTLCFFSGITFGYFVVLPTSLDFFQSFGSIHIENNIAVNEYVSFFMGTMFTTGIMFELPFAAYVLSIIGILTPMFMRKFRRYAVVFNLIIAAIVTPSTDALTMGLVAVPMMILYEVSIVISAAVTRRQKQTEAVSKST